MSEIIEWYAGKNVLVTGATGFIGKVLVERLLRECEDVNSIYLIVRAKKNFDARCKELLNHIAFDHIRESKPKQFDKIKFFQGDLTQENLGLSSENVAEILQNTDIVLHSGADVRFDVPLRGIFNTNTVGTYRLMELAKQIKKLQIFVFVSTAYSQSNQYVTEERNYDPVMNAFVLMKAFDRFDDQVMSALQSKILKEFPNTYSFSKHLSEYIVHQYRDEIPICVVRPSIVSSAINFPKPYYTEGLNGLNGWCYSAARGVMRTTLCNTDSQAHLIPVDIVANAIIATSWIHGTKKVEHIEYYTANMRPEHLFSMVEANNMAKRLYKFEPLNYSLWYPNSTVTSCVYYFYLRVYFYSILPSFILDLLIRAFGRRPIMLKIQRKIVFTLALLRPYLQKTIFETNNFRNIENYLCSADRVTFDTNIDDLTFEKMVKINVKGTRRYLAKEKDEDIPRARKIYMMWTWIHFTMQSIIVFYVVKFVFSKIFTNFFSIK